MEILIWLALGAFFVIFSMTAVVLFAAFVIERELDQFDEEN